MTKGTVALDPRVLRTRKRALDAAAGLLIAQGIGAVTFDGVRRETGIARTTLYRHWDRPVDLVIDTWELLTQPPAVPNTGDLRADLIDVLVNAAGFLEASPLGAALPSLVDAAERDVDLARLHARFTARRRQPILDRLQRAVDTGVVRSTTDLELVTDLLTGPIFYRRLLSRASTDAAYVEALVDAVLEPLRPATPN